MWIQRNLRETRCQCLYMYVALTCNWTERSRSPWTMGLNLSMARHSPAVVMASRTFSKLNENMKCMSEQLGEKENEGTHLFQRILTVRFLLFYSFSCQFLPSEKGYVTWICWENKWSNNIRVLFTHNADGWQQLNHISHHGRLGRINGSCQ